MEFPLREVGGQSMMIDLERQDHLLLNRVNTGMIGQKMEPVDLAKYHVKMRNLPRYRRLLYPDPTMNEPIEPVQHQRPTLHQQHIQY